MTDLQSSTADSPEPWTSMSGAQINHRTQRSVAGDPGQPVTGTEHQSFTLWLKRCPKADGEQLFEDENWLSVIRHHSKIPLFKKKTLGHFIFRWNQSLRPWSKTKTPVWDLINAKSKVTLSFGLRLKSQTKLWSETLVWDQSLVSDQT